MPPAAARASPIPKPAVGAAPLFKVDEMLLDTEALVMLKPAVVEETDAEAPEDIVAEETFVAEAASPVQASIDW